MVLSFSPDKNKKTKTLSGCFRNTLLWLHTVFAVLYLILTVFLLKRHTSQIKARPRETVSHRLCKDYKRLSSALYVRRLWRLLSQRSLIGRQRLIASDWPFVCLWRTCFSGLQTRNTLLVCSVPKTATEEAIATHFMWAKMSKFTLAGFFFFSASQVWFCLVPNVCLCVWKVRRTPPVECALWLWATMWPSSWTLIRKGKKLGGGKKK